MGKHCPSCGFDLSSVMVKKSTSREVEEQHVEQPEKIETVKVVTKRGMSDKQKEALKKAREKRLENHKAKKEKEQEDVGGDFQPLFLF